MIIEQREEALLYLEEILFDGDNAENGPRAKLAWLIDLTSSLKELMDLGKNNSAFRDLIFTRDFAFQILDGFPSKLRRKLRKCEGEGQVLFENMVNKIEVFRENAQEEVNKLDDALYDLSANDATKVDVFKLSEHQIEKIMKDKVSLDDTRAYKAVIVDEYGQLDDLKGAIADVNSLDEPQEDFNARISISKKIEHNPGEECKDPKEWELEEYAEAFEDMHGSLADKFNVNEEAGYNNDEIDENDKELDDKTTKDIEKDDVDLNHSKIAKNLEVKVNLNDANALKAVVNVGKKLLDDSEASIAEVNAYEDSTATVFLPRIDLNANFVKKEVEHCSDETSENFDGRSNDICDEVKLETENMKESEYSAIDSSFDRDFADDGPNINGDQKKEVVVVVTENDKEDVTAEESFVMKTVRIFKNKKYLRSETYRIQENYLISFDVKRISSEDQMNNKYDVTDDDGDEYVNVHGEILNASDRELLENVGKDSKEDVRDGDDDEITAYEVDYTNKLDGGIVDTNDGNVIVYANEYSEAHLAKQPKFTEPEINAVNLRYEGDGYSPVFHGEKLDMKNIFDDTVEAENEVVKAITGNYEVNGGYKKPIMNEAPRFKYVKELEADNLVFVARLMQMHHDVARLDEFKRFHRFLWRPGDPSYPSYSVLLINTAIPHVSECCVFTIAVLIMSCTGVNKQEELVVKNIQMSEYEEFTTRLKEKVFKAVNDKEEIVKRYTMNIRTALNVRLKACGNRDLPRCEVDVQHNVKTKLTKLKMTEGCMNCRCYPHCILNYHWKTVGTLDFDVELSKEFRFPDMLDRAWDEFEDYKVELYDGMLGVQDKLVYLLHAINIDLGQAEYDDEEDEQLSFFASANTSEVMPSTQSGLRAGMGYCFMLVGALLQVSVSRTDNSAYPS